MHVRAARFPGSPLSLRFGRVGAHAKSFGRVVSGRPCQLVRAGRSGATRSGRLLGRTSPYQKMLSCDPRLALCTFVQLVFPALPCPFVSVVRAPMQNRSGGSFQGVRVNSFGRVGSFGRNSFGRGAFGRTSPYQEMLSCDPRLALCTFMQLVCPALPCPFVSVVRAPM